MKINNFVMIIFKDAFKKRIIVYKMLKIENKSKFVLEKSVITFMVPQ